MYCIQNDRERPGPMHSQPRTEVLFLKTLYSNHPTLREDVKEDIWFNKMFGNRINVITRELGRSWYGIAA